ncbi:hypothetical protein ACFL22_00665 [Patescibacteria group bacterium]
MTKKIITMILGVYLSLGFIFAMYAYSESIKTFDCVFPSYMKHQNVGMGGFYTNPYPEFCTRRAFTLQSIAMIPMFTALGVPLIVVRFSHALLN